MALWLAALFAGPLAVAGCTSAAAPATSAGRHQQPHTVTAARGGRDQAELDIVSGASSITIGTARLRGELLSASTPANSGVAPDLVIGRLAPANEVQVFLDGTGRPGPAALRVVLNSAVTWRLVFSGGANQISADLGAGQFGGADFAAGTGLITMRLPEPDGKVTIVLAGGASQVNLSVPAGVPARLRLDGGASSATIGGHSYTGIAGGTVLTTLGWAEAASRYEIDAPAGLSAISVTSG